MKANELRIGNIIKLPNNEWEAVFCVAIEGGVYHVNGYKISDCHPIPLTPEWLERFGAHIHKMTQRTYCNLDIINPKYDGGLTVCYWFMPNGELEKVWLVSEEIEYDHSFDQERSHSFDQERSWDYTDKLKYVHQLQNLYLAHTGEELEIKDDE